MRRIPRSFVLPLLAFLAIPLAGCVSRDAEDLPSRSPYVDLAASEVRGLDEETIDVLENGKGGGFAIPAEINGYPGPKHVLELGDSLELTPAQRERTQALFERTNAAARRVGGDALAAHAALDAAFANGTIDEPALDALLADLEDAYARLRFVHLQAHLEMVDLLSREQIARYSELRGYSGSGHDANAGHAGHE